MFVNDMVGNKVEEFSPLHSAVFQTNSGPVHVILSADGNGVTVAAMDDRRLRFDRLSENSIRVEVK